MSGHQLKGQCNQCGMCCQAICLPISMKQIKEYQAVKDYIETGKLSTTDDGRLCDVLFIYLYWKQIAAHEAFKINPYLKSWRDSKKRKFYYYTCNQYDKVNKKCLIHDNNPRVCNKYPWYDGEPNPRATFYTPDCGYKLDIL